MYVAGVKRSFILALDKATEDLSSKIDESKKEVTDMVRGELKAADKALRGDLANLHQKIDETHKKLEEVKTGTPSAAVMRQLEEMNKKIDARDWITVKPRCQCCWC